MTIVQTNTGQYINKLIFLYVWMAIVQTNTGQYRNKYIFQPFIIFLHSSCIFIIYRDEGASSKIN